MIEVTTGRLVEFSFASQIAEDLSRDALVRLARQCWSDNHRAGVTGTLRLFGSRLEQTVEGPSAVVLALSARILTDHRHCKIVVRRLGPIAARRFAGWSVEGLEPPAAIAAGAARLGLRLMVRTEPPPAAAAARRPRPIAQAT